MKTKRTLALIFFLIFGIVNLFSQIPNNGFELWSDMGTYQNPQDWWTTNDSSAGTFYPVTRSPDHYPASLGNYSIRIENNPSLLFAWEAFGIAALINSVSSFGPGFSITGHPTSLTGYYKYLPQNGDTMDINILLYQSGVEVANGRLISTAVVSNWTTFNIPLSNYSTADSGRIHLGSYYSDGSYNVPNGNSILFIDNLNFDTLLIGSQTAQSSQSFKYQAVARDNAGNILSNQNVSFRMSILHGSTTGNAVYVETHNTVTNQFGLVNLEIGNGNVVSGVFANINWPDGLFFIKTEMDPAGGSSYTYMGTSQLLSVPYALYSENTANIDDADADPTNEMQTLSQLGTDVTLSNGGGTISTVDSDNDASNELQTISKVGSTVTLTDGGGFFNDDVDDADNDSSNELQTLSQSGTDVTLSNGGGTISVSDNDNDTINEIQTISKIGSTVTLSDGGGSFNDDVNDADNDPINELQTLSQVGTDVTLSNGGGTISVSDNDNDTTNELQTISRVGITVTLSDGGGSFTDSVNVYTAGFGIDITNQIISISGHYVGEIYGGGIVFWITPDRQHGLIASLDNLDSLGVEWGLYGTNVPNCESMTDGAANTDNIITAGVGSGEAAGLCNAYTGGGFTDWYLPSTRELYLLASQDILIDGILDNDGDPNTNGLIQEPGPTIGRYWSSTEGDLNNAYIYVFKNGYTWTEAKYSVCKVRAVRAF